jgi:hypothetical protein
VLIAKTIARFIANWNIIIFIIFLHDWLLLIEKDSWNTSVALHGPSMNTDITLPSKGISCCGWKWYLIVEKIGCFRGEIATQQVAQFYARASLHAWLPIVLIKRFPQALQPFNHQTATTKNTTKKMCLYLATFFLHACTQRGRMWKGEKSKSTFTACMVRGGMLLQTTIQAAKRTNGLPKKNTDVAWISYILL